MNRKLFYLFFWLILFVAILLRFVKLGQVPTSLYWDETAMYIDAGSVATTGMDMHGRPWYQLIYPSYGDYKLPVYIWLAGLSFKVFGASDWALRLPSALAGIGTIIIAGLISKLLFKNQKTQLATMLVVAILPWSIMFSRTAFEGHLAQFLVGLSVWLQLLALTDSSSTKKANFFKLLLATFIGGLATYTYFSVRFVWPVIFGTIQLLHHQTKLKQSILTAGFFITIFFIALLPMMNSPLYEVSNKFRLSASSVLNLTDYPVLANTYRQTAGNTSFDRLYFHRHYLLLRELAKNYSDHLNLNYLFLSGDANLRHGTTQHGLFLLAFLPIFIIGLFSTFSRQWRIGLILIIWWIIALLPASVPETTPHALRSLNALIPLSILIGVGLASFSKNKILLFMTTLLIAVNLLHFTNHYFVHYARESAPVWQDGYKEMVAIVEKEKSGVRAVWVGPLEIRFYLWLLAYGNYSSSQIQALPKSNFEIKQIDNITFTEFDWKKLATLDHKILVVGEIKALTEKINAGPIKPNWTNEIAGADGIPRFLIAHYGQ